MKGIYVLQVKHVYTTKLRGPVKNKMQTREGVQTFLVNELDKNDQ